MAAFVPTLFLRKLFRHPDGREILVREDTLGRFWLVDLRAVNSWQMRRFTLGTEAQAADTVLTLIGDEPDWRDDSPHAPQD